MVTSRNGAWREVANSLPVDVFDRRESIELLRRRGPDLAVNDADRLAAALGDPSIGHRAGGGLARRDEDASRRVPRTPRRQPVRCWTTGRLTQQDYPELVAAETWNVSLNWLRDQDLLSIAAVAGVFILRSRADRQGAPVEAARASHPP